MNYETGSIPEIFELITDLAKKLDQLQRLVMRESNLTPPQYNILNVLTGSEGQSLSQLAAANNCTRPTMTSLVDTLEKKKLVIREPNPGDRRSILVKLTEKGEVLKQSLPSLNRVFGSCCSGLEPVDRQQLSSLLKKLDASLDLGGSCRE